MEEMRKFVRNCDKVIGIIETETFVPFELFGYPLTPELYRNIKAYFISASVPLAYALISKIQEAAAAAKQ